MILWIKTILGMSVHKQDGKSYKRKAGVSEYCRGCDLKSKLCHTVSYPVCKGRYILKEIK